jgi:hypothetical protein
VHRLNEQEEQASSFSWKEPLESESEEREWKDNDGEQPA